MPSLESITVTDIENILTVTSRQGETWVMKKRSSWGLSFCKEGQITYTQRGKKYVSDKSVAILLPEGQSYSLHRDKGGAFPIINFYMAEPISDRIQLFPISDPESYISDLETMQRLSLLPKNRARVMSLFYGILHRVSAEQSASYSAFAAIENYVEEHYADLDITNSLIADSCGISEVYLRKLFLKKCGKTPRKYIIDLRMSRARQLLSDGALSVAEIAELCGFSSPYHFSRSFKVNHGITPSEYAARNRTKNI